MNGKFNRLQRISEKERYLIIPIDHGTTLGPIPGIENIHNRIKILAEAEPTAIVAHKGIWKAINFFPTCGQVLHLSANTQYGPYPNYKVLVGSVEEALRLGVDAVSIHINIGGSQFEPKMIQDLGRIAASCDEWQVPLLAMVYPRGPNIVDPNHSQVIANVVRTVAELGADIIKTHYPGTIAGFEKIVEGCPIPVLIAGGPKMENDRDLLQMVKNSITAGGVGISLGRNIFQHPRPQAIIRALRGIIIDNLDVDDSYNLYLS